MNQRTIRILLAGGGSGGHIYPLLAVVESLKELAKAENCVLDLRYCGPIDQYTNDLALTGVRLIPIMAGKMRRYASLANFVDIPKWFIGLIQAFFKIYFFMPDVTFSKGGTGALPVVLASYWYHVPVMIHESDATPGLTNLISARFAKRIGVSFESALQYFNPKKVALVGNPIRERFRTDHMQKETAKEELHFDRTKPLIVVLGGSQGSQRINEFIVANLSELLKGFQILHQTGSAHHLEMKKLSEAALQDVSVTSEIKNPYRIVPFLNEKEMKNALDAADLVIARAGSGTIAEIALFGKPSILIPLKESANDHQRSNAYGFAAGGGAIVIEEDNLTPQIFIHQVQLILKDDLKAKTMGEKALQFARPDAAHLLAEELLRLIK